MAAQKYGLKVECLDMEVCHELISLSRQTMFLLMLHMLLKVLQYCKPSEVAVLLLLSAYEGKHWTSGLVQNSRFEIHEAEGLANVYIRGVKLVFEITFLENFEGGRF